MNVTPLDFVVIDGDEMDAGHMECPVRGCWWEGPSLSSGSYTLGDLIAEAAAHLADAHS